MPGQWNGLREIQNNFKRFQFAGKQIQSKYLQLIGDSCVQLLKVNTPQDTGDLARSWKIVSKGNNFIEVGTEMIDIVANLASGTRPHLIVPRSGNVLRFERGGQEIFAAQVFHPGTFKNPFLDEVNRVMSRIIISTLEHAMRTSHPYFQQLKGIGGKGRKFQQVGRTSAGFKFGTSSRGRSKLVRAGTGRRQLKRKLTLRRRTASGPKPKKLKLRLG